VIGVVIPYFQRKPGLLNRALRSIAAQEGEHRLRVYVVDDASPVPAEGELAGLDESFAEKIVILRQPNGGPGTARNLALDKMTDDIGFVAFLDSDDAWGKNHLHNVTAAFAAGADFYLADHQREEDSQTRFAQCGYWPKGAAVVGTGDAVLWCDARTMFREILQRSPVGTSTVAIRRSKIGQLRFPTWLRSAGEDSIFWLELLRGDMRVAAGMTSEVSYGRGVSIFNHRGWGNAAAVRTTFDEMQMQIHLRRNFPLDREMLAQSNAQSRRLDLAFCANLIACVRRLQWSAAGLAWAYIRQRPEVLLRLPGAALGVLWRQAERK